MLVLSRRIGETIVINEDIRITVLGTNGGRITLGIVAPADIPVHRQEVFERLVNQRKEWNAPRESLVGVS